MRSEANNSTPAFARCRHCKQRFDTHSAKLHKCLFESTYFSPSDPRAGRTVSLLTVPTKTLVHWLKEARKHRCGGEYHPPGWGRVFTIANLTAELSQRADRHDYGKPARKKARQELAKARKNR